MTHRPRPLTRFLLPLATLAGLAVLPGCSHDTSSGNGTGGADLSTHLQSSADVAAITATISGPALPAPTTVALSSRNDNVWGALIGSLPVGSNYVFTVSAADASNTPLYAGSATGIAIIANQVTSVVIIAQQVSAPPPYQSAVPIIDSLLVSSNAITPGASVTAKVTAHDLNPSNTISFAWSTNPAAAGSFSAPTAATTQWTAPSSDGPVTLIVTVTDSTGATTSASVVVSVANANATGQAAVTVGLNTWPVVTDILAAPSYITLGQPVALNVVATDADNNPLTYAWTSTCAAGVFSAAGAASTSFTLPSSDTDKSCTFNVAISDGQGGSTSGQTVLPVGAPTALGAPSITASLQSAAVVDANGIATFSVTASDPNQSALTFAWLASGGTLSAQSNTASTSTINWTAPATASVSLTVSVVVTDALGISTQFNFAVGTAAITTACTPPASTAWSFGVMSDTQWTCTNSSGSYVDPSGANQNSTSAVSIADQITPQFVAAGVKFVIQVGDLADVGDDADETVRANAAQTLYNAGIGFFPMRGNHEYTASPTGSNSYALPIFKTLYPQTQGQGNNLFGATNFTSPSSVVGSSISELDGMSYSFDYNNVRFVIIDPWVTPLMDISAAGYSYGYSIAQQEPWIDSRLDKSTRGTDHAFVLAHQPLMAEDHQDTMFQGYTNANPAWQNAFYTSLQSNGVKYFLAGHDHMNQHSIVASPDGTASVHELIGASDSSKFYTPEPLNDANWFGQKTRETSIAQELYTVGYYIFTVDGPNVTVDYYSDTHGNWQSSGSYPMGANNATYPLWVTPVFTFAKHQTWGYSLNGSEFLVAQGASYPTTPFTFQGTTAQFLAGKNSSTAQDYNGRALPHAVDIGWDAGNCSTYGSVLNLWGTSDIAATKGDTIVLSMSFNGSQVSDATLVSGGFGLATQGSAGTWTNAVAQNVGGAPTFVIGAWNASYGLGTFGVDPATDTAWAVVNHAGHFAIAQF